MHSRRCPAAFKKPDSSGYRFADPFSAAIFSRARHHRPRYSLFPQSGRGSIAGTKRDAVGRQRACRRIHAFRASGARQQRVPRRQPRLSLPYAVTSNTQSLVARSYSGSQPLASQPRDIPAQRRAHILSPLHHLAGHRPVRRRVNPCCCRAARPSVPSPRDRWWY